MYYLGDRHRAQRKLLNPAFSIAHMREIGIFQEFASRHRPIDRALFFFSPHLLRSRLSGNYLHTSLLFKCSIFANHHC